MIRKNKHNMHNKPDAHSRQTEEYYKMACVNSKGRGGRRRKEENVNYVMQNMVGKQRKRSKSVREYRLEREHRKGGKEEKRCRTCNFVIDDQQCQR